MRVIGVIPARYGSTRLAGKPLADIHGKPMIQHVYELTCKARTLDRVVVATDDQRVCAAVKSFGGTAMMTKSEHFSGMDRVAEVASESDADIVVNVQGDEPLLDPLMIDECVEALKNRLNAELSTVVKAIGEETFHDPSVVKVVRDTTGRALYFSRSLLPYPRNRTADFRVFEHIGLYAYSKDCLVRLAKLPPTPLEQIEGLEQLRALENGIAIQVVETKSKQELVSVDTQQDLEKVRHILAGRNGR
jgi:3-deoxy-manno-octulosonate cytidylyltransferase (CMP-KDO synthetase)